MNTQQKILLAFVTLFSALLLIIGMSIMAQDEIGEKPTLVPAAELIPLQMPEEEFKEIVILQLIVEAESPRQIEIVRLQEASIMRSFAPNVFNLSGGPWEVELILEDEEPLRFTVISPLDIEAEVERAVEDETGQEIPPFEYVTSINTHEWGLALPLYRDESSLNVQVINVLFEGEVVLETEVNYDEWRETNLEGEQ